MPLNEQPALTPQRAVKTLQTAFIVMFIWMCSLPFIQVRMRLTSSVPPPQSSQLIISLFAIAAGAAVVYLRFGLIAGLSSPLEPMNETTLAQKIWMYHIFCFVFSEVTALFGFALAVMHADPKFYVPLYLAGPILMLLCYPRLPANE